MGHRRRIIFPDSHGAPMDPRLDMVVDVVDAQNRVVSHVERKELFKRRLNFRTVHIELFDREGRVILQRLASNHPRSPKLLGSSVAGYLHAGETYRSAARRKLKEELGVTARIRKIGQLKMSDVGSQKFIAVYSGTLLHEPVVSDELIDVLVHIDPVILARKVREDPASFTPTFVRIYELFERWVGKGRRR